MSFLQTLVFEESLGTPPVCGPQRDSHSRLPLPASKNLHKINMFFGLKTKIFFHYLKFVFCFILFETLVNLPSYALISQLI